MGIQEAISKKLPAAVEDLPILGKIKWTVKELPFVQAGPSAGISGMGMVVINKRIYLVGGFIPEGDDSDDISRRTSKWAYCYDPVSASWTKLPDLPERREYTRAISAGHSIYVVGGGIQTKPHYLPSADVFRLDLASNSRDWLRVGQLSMPRTHMAVGTTGGFLIVSGGNEYLAAKGGYGKDTIRDVTDVLDLSKPAAGWVERSPIPGLPRGWTASSAIGGKLYVFGGVTWTDTGAERIKETLAYDPLSDSWKRLADPPLAMSGWASDVYNERYVILVGGVAATSDRATLWNDVPLVYDLVDDKWFRIDSPLPPGGLFNDPGVCIIGDSVYVAGGEGPEGSHFNYFLVGEIEPAIP